MSGGEAADDPSRNNTYKISIISGFLRQWNQDKRFYEVFLVIHIL